MTKQAIITRTLDVLRRLPESKAAEISAFADFVAKRYDEYTLTQGVQTLAAEGNAFAFLAEEEDLYTEADLKERYRG